MTSLIFYTKPVGLNKSEHKNLKIVPQSDDFAFATKTNSVILAGVEFTEAAKDFPIVFAEAGGNIVPVALLGLRNEQNLFVNDDGSWAGRYIPAFIRRYPFILSETTDTSDNQFCIACMFGNYKWEENTEWTVSNHLEYVNTLYLNAIDHFVFQKIFAMSTAHH